MKKRPKTVMIEIPKEAALLGIRRTVPIFERWAAMQAYSFDEPPTLMELCMWCYYQGAVDGSTATENSRTWPPAT